MPKNIIDAGAVIAYLDPTEGANHVWARELFARHGFFITCEAVIAEACSRLAYGGQSQARVIALVEEDILRLQFNAGAHVSRIRRLMEKYANRPMDFADACLVVMAEDLRDPFLFTLDAADFSVYRRHGRDVMPFESPRHA